uniref:F-box protein CPR30-like n=1 Tax=Nicotiana tabacum TaxID=4097 RepID=A0A1S4BXR1_TOBAC|nr:PREDICTED: F-box protein CPR30-like [Nicotiana tabacum]
MYIEATGCIISPLNLSVYKPVLIMDHLTRTCGFVIVASLLDKKWRRLEFPYDIRSVRRGGNRGGVTLHERIHYMVRVEKPYFGTRNHVIYFDPITETFHKLLVPESAHRENVTVGLGVVNECLRRIMTCLDDDKNEEFMMKEYGVKKSWTVLFDIKKFKIYSPWGFAARLLVTENKELLVFMIHDRRFKVGIYDLHCNMGDINYVESLISPKEYKWIEKWHIKFGRRLKKIW